MHAHPSVPSVCRRRAARDADAAEDVALLLQGLMAEHAQARARAKMEPNCVKSECALNV